MTDSLLGDISGEFTATRSTGPGRRARHGVLTYTPWPIETDPLLNAVTASGNGADSGVEASDEASCDTDVLNPAIGVTKSCTELAHVGDTVTYTITVTNTGDEDLDNVTVNDTILGDLVRILRGRARGGCIRVARLPVRRASGRRRPARQRSHGEGCRASAVGWPWKRWPTATRISSTPASRS